MTNNNLATNLRRARNYRKMSVKELGRRADLSHSQILRIEDGKYDNPQYQTLIRLADALEMPIESLVSSDTCSKKNMRYLSARLMELQKEQQHIIDIMCEIGGIK